MKGETQTMATITIQNYFRMYEKLAGMTGTAETEETEFFQIYKLEVAVIPTNRPMVREDRHDLVYKTRREKYNAIVEETRRLHELGYPGARSARRASMRRRRWRRCSAAAGIHAQRAQRQVPPARGGDRRRRRSAGRGHDRDEHGRPRNRHQTRRRRDAIRSRRKVKDPDGKEIDVMEIGGLHIIGSERHESRRIDRQLRGRSGRQGDPGASQFFLSLEDDLMRLFGSERIAKLMDRLGAQEGEVLTHPLITRSIEQAQKRVELQNFQARKRLLEYDDVMNQQREVIYSLRSFALEGGEELKGEALKMIEKAIAHRVETTLAEYDEATQWDFDLLRQDLLMHYLLQVPEYENDESPPDRR